MFPEGSFFGGAFFFVGYAPVLIYIFIKRATFLGGVVVIFMMSGSSLENGYPMPLYVEGNSELILAMRPSFRISSTLCHLVMFIGKMN